MRKRLISLFVVPLASLLVLATGGHVTYAETASPQSHDSRTVTVQQGDYLEKLAQDNGTTYLRLFYANDEIKDPNVIYPGENLRVPDTNENLAERPLPIGAAVPTQIVSTPVTQAVTQSAGSQTVSAAPTPVAATPVSSDTSIWDQLAACEAGGNWAINTGNGFYGGLQFTLSSWQAVGGSGYPNQASRSEQIYRGQILQSRQGWGAWPACSAKLGLR